MGRRILHLMLALALLFGAPLPVRADTLPGEPVIEQVLVNLPEIQVLGYNLGSGTEAYLAGKQLRKTGEVPCAESGLSTDYYLLMDVSNSIPDSYFREIKESVKALPAWLSPGDTLSLVTFGESVQMVGEFTRDPDMGYRIDQIRNTDNRTMLFEAISQTSRIAAEQPGLRRNIFLIVSDGEDVAEGKAVAAEALEVLNRNQIPVYAFGIRQTARENLNSFGEFARASGGEIRIFSAGGLGEALADALVRIGSAELLTFSADTNRVPAGAEQLSLQIPGRNTAITREISSYRYQPDLTAPVVLQAAQVEGRRIRVTFSESVSGAEDPAAYTLRSGESAYPVGAVARDGEAENSYILTVSEGFPEGEYDLVCSGITDDSEEENPVENVFSLELSKSDPDPTVIETGRSDTRGLALGLLAFLAGLTLFFVFLANSGRKKKQAAKAAEEAEAAEAARQNASAPVYGESGLFTPGPEEKHHVRIENAPGKEVRFVVSAGGAASEIRMRFSKSMMVGRSDLCDLYFDDLRMSAQHFCLEWDGESMFITDLNSTNGTMLNGIRVLGRRRIVPGDRVTAGTVDLRIDW